MNCGLTARMWQYLVSYEGFHSVRNQQRLEIGYRQVRGVRCKARTQILVSSLINFLYCSLVTMLCFAVIPKTPSSQNTIVEVPYPASVRVQIGDSNTDKRVYVSITIGESSNCVPFNTFFTACSPCWSKVVPNDGVLSMITELSSPKRIMSTP